MIDLDVTDAPLAQVMTTIAQQVGVEIFVDPNVDVTVTERFRNIEWKLAVALIAKTYNCEAMQDVAGNVHVGQIACFHMSFTRSRLRAVLNLLATYAGLHLVMDSEIDDVVTLRCFGGGMGEGLFDGIFPCLQAVARTSNLAIGLRDGLLLVTKAPAGWGDFDFDPLGHLQGDTPAYRAPDPGLRLEARGAPAVAWFRLLADCSPVRQFVIAGDVTSRISASVSTTDCLEAMSKIAAEHALRFEHAGAYFLLRSGSGPVPMVPPAPSHSVELPGHRAVSVSLQGTVTYAQSPGAVDDSTYEAAVLNGGVYRVGEALREVDSDEDLPLVVHEIRWDAVHLRALGSDSTIVIPLPDQ
ncbi:MAG: hypothetical protein KDD82_31620 [Planctomycetes bacterium]|nr:hypothetical protein [Planctomycetota bacterium]